ncbi:hypothetical protein ACIGQE_28190 [Streptomyces sp. NPDC053429]|uniref:hypothetical protein n=1 Tax=Streptomyces sp. NPDC053429 TaxID=3365702 RepID=UPI0037D7CAB9
MSGAALLGANSAWMAYQKGVGASTTAKSVLTGAALAATAYSRVLGKKVERAASPDSADQEAVRPPRRSATSRCCSGPYRL